MKLNRKGFTLVELMVVLAILGLLAGIGIPQYVKTLENSKLATDRANAGALTRAVQSYVAETGSALTATLLGQGNGTTVVTEPTQRQSILSGADIDLADFWPSPLPKIVSTKGTDAGGYWYWSGNAVVFSNGATPFVQVVP